MLSELHAFQEDLSRFLRDRGFAAIAVQVTWFLLCIGLGLIPMVLWFSSDVASWATRSLNGWWVADGVVLVVSIGIPAYLLGKSLYFCSLWLVFTPFRALDENPTTPMDEKYGLAFDIPGQLGVYSMMAGEIYPRSSIQRHFLRDLEKLEQAGTQGQALAARLVKVRNTPNRRAWQHRDLAYLVRSLQAVGLSSSTQSRMRPEVLARRRKAKHRLEPLVMARFDAWLEAGGQDGDYPYPH